MKNQRQRQRKNQAAKVNQIKYNPNNSTQNELKQININNFLDGANWEKTQIIDFTCDWISENIENYLEKDSINIELLIEDYRKEIYRNM